MAKRTRRRVLSASQLREFDAQYDTRFEDQANRVRGQFLKAFPINSLKKLTLKKYAIGQRTPSFCTYVEAKTKPWANILGSTSFKFGVYFGRTKSNARRRYRFVKKFGPNEKKAFSKIKQALLELMTAGQQMQFEKIDENPL